MDISRDLSMEPDSGPMVPKSGGKNGDRKRAYKACIYCRMRKAKCEFDDPSSRGVPPCIRCRRENRQCLFLPSRRGGRANIEKGIAIKKNLNSKADIGEPSGIDHNTRSNDPSPNDAAHVRDDNVPVAAEQLAEAPLRNPSDALDILARTSPQGSGTPGVPNSFQLDGEQTAGNGVGDNDSSKRCVSLNSNGQSHVSRKNNDLSETSTAENISNYPPIKLGLINPTQLRTFVSVFLTRHHHYLPLIPESKLPVNDRLLGIFAAEEPFLLTAIVIIASRFEKQPVHLACWNYMRDVISSIVFGGEPTVGVVEGLLLLSENIPRPHKVGDNDLHHHEALMSWNFVGLAVRFSYFLGLDQKTLLSPDQVMDEVTSRERLAWTYCYIHDRQVSIRLGKAFWSRGPGLCFQSPPNVGVNMDLEAHINFPTLAPSTSPILSPSNNSQTAVDNASLVQAFVELTQILTNVHDTLYPSRDRTIALVQIGEYYRMLDEFTRTFTAFLVAWKDNPRWSIFPLNETVWATYHYAKLYAYSFAFQAHVQRATKKKKEQLHNLNSRGSLADIIFPRGLAGCPDAKFILEAVKSASSLLRICVDDLYKEGALAYLPSRFYSYFNYAAVFLIKVVFTGAVVANEQKEILTLVKRVIWAFRAASSTVDRQHPGVRSARQLKTLVTTLVMATGTSIANSPEQSTPREKLNEPVSDNNGVMLAGNGTAGSPLNLDPFDFNSVNYGTGSLSEVASLFSEDASDAGTNELTALLSTEIDSEVWLSFFD